MGHAWLDSLSEDWVSQAGSDESQCEAAQSKKGSLRPTDTIASSASRQSGSIANSCILSERSPNESRVVSGRVPSKLLPEAKAKGRRGRHTQRSQSTSTIGSVMYNTVEHKSHSVSPSKKDTPEWRRRIIQGDLAYGEQLDLFTPSRLGLENIFQPPPPAVNIPPMTKEEEEESSGQEESVALPKTATEAAEAAAAEPATDEHEEVDDTVNKHPQDESKLNDTTMSSSPPFMRRQYDVSSNSADAYRANQTSEFEESVWQDRPSPEESAASASVEESQVRQKPKGFESRVISGQSGQSVLRNESFSAILISPKKDDNDDGAVFGEIELPPGELKRRLENLRWNQMVLTDDVAEHAGSGSVSLGSRSHPENSEDYEKLGGFINFRRGGRSNDGSFRVHLLSPSLGGDTSDMLPEESLQASTPKQFPTIRTEKASTDQNPNDRLQVPKPSLEKLPKGQYLQPAPAPAGSPLKLFGPYDTFTNQTLMRRISQFEDQMSNGSGASGHHSSDQEAEEASRSALEPSEPSFDDEPRKSEVVGQETPRHMSAQFGGGELDGYSFNDEFSGVSPGQSELPNLHLSTLQEEEEEQTDLCAEKEPELPNQRLRQSGTFNSSRPSTARDQAEERVHPFATPATPLRMFEFGSEKRARPSPSKDPTPKRRRTLHKSDIAFEADETRTDAGHDTMQSMVGGESELQFDKDFFTYRQMHGDASEEDSESYIDVMKRGLQNSKNQSGSSSDAYAAVNRKPSIRTEDFMNEAHKIMAMLRNRGVGIPNGLEDVEESTLEIPKAGPSLATQVEEYEGSIDESTKEPFSRPPSREGHPILRVTRVQQDPEVVARLKKYAERSDIDELVSSTTRSINLAQGAIVAERRAEQAVQETLGASRARTRLEDDDVISDPPNIRVSENPERSQRSGSISVVPGVQDSMPSQVSQGSTSSLPTGSSRGSDTRKTIMPQTVSHLIPDQVGNMMLDRDKNIWIRRSRSSSRPSLGSIVHSEASEEDPFADIPDLSVDVTMELNNLQPRTVSTSSQAAKPAEPAEPTEAHDHEPSISEASSFMEEDGTVEHEISIDEGRRSEAARKRHIAISFSSPIASIIENFVADNDADDDDEELDRLEVEDAADGPSNGEISPLSARRGPRSVSVKFRSASANVRPRSVSQKPSRHFSLNGQSFVSRPISRIDEREEDGSEQRFDLSVVGDRSTLVPGSSEETGTPMGRKGNISLVLTTPGDRTMDAMVRRADDEEILAQCVGMLSLTPMSEFTMHRERTLALEGSYVLGARHLVTGDRAAPVMSQSLSSLVERLAEVEPFEPYWEDIEELDVQGKRLESLHKLDEFCPQLVTLDAADNALHSLGGIPTSVRHLRVVSNQLSELTSWARLTNLQYLDISNNSSIKTLSGLMSLVHLRGLKADQCGLTSLEGIKYHDALQTLRARGNAIEAVDFGGTRLQKLVELDLEDNRIEQATHLDELEMLVTLNLRGNRLEQFDEDSVGVLAQVRKLDVSDNVLTALDVGGMPALRTLLADRNGLVRVTGFGQTPRLDSVSLREQRLAGTSDSSRLDVSSLYEAYEVRKLYLSGNSLVGGGLGFDPPADFLNLQLLEMANCGLMGLPDDFGRRTPNLRKLNVNLNGLRDLRCLRGIPRLKRLLVAGNRLAAAHAVVQVLAGFRHLAEVDLRDNPLTQGFYGPVGHGPEPEPKHEPFTLPWADEARDQAYCGRLDIATGMRRRVYEQVVGEACGKLRRLDGLPVRRDLGEVRDGVWEALRARGIVGEGRRTKTGAKPLRKASGTGSSRPLSRKVSGTGTERPSSKAESAQWEAEDTFA